MTYSYSDYHEYCGEGDRDYIYGGSNDYLHVFPVSGRGIYVAMKIDVGYSGGSCIGSSARISGLSLCV